MIGSSATVSAAMPFYDVKKTAWYYDEVEYCYNNYLMRGMSDTKFSPNSEMTRAMFVVVLANISNVPYGRYTFSCFTATWGYDYKIVSGTGNGKFSPHKAITREEACVMVSRYLEAFGVTLNKNTNVLNNYKDSNKISSWAREGVAAAINAGLVSGVSSDTLDPKGIINRASCARLAMQMNVLYPDAKRIKKPW